MSVQIGRARHAWRTFLLAASFMLLGGCGRAAGDDAAAFRSEFSRTDFAKRTVSLDEIFSGGPPRDGIPSIDRPRFVSTAQAASWLRPDEPVIALEIAGEVRAYPLQILMFHEIVNDTAGGVPVAVTFCPLCNAAIVFERRVGGQVLDFGTTGRLRKSDLVMYDRQTESWWQQFTGTGIIGRHAGTTLRQLPSQVVSFAEFAEAHRAGKVLSRETAHKRPYGRNPYRGYDRVGQNPFLFFDPVDPRLPAMERVLGISISDRHRLYPLSMLEKSPVINDDFAGTPLVVLSAAGMLSVLDDDDIARSRRIPAAAAYSRTLDGKPLNFERREAGLFDRETGSRWNVLGHAVSGTLEGRRLTPVEGGVHFAFAWLAFRPDSEIYSAQKSSLR